MKFINNDYFAWMLRQFYIEVFCNTEYGPLLNNDTLNIANWLELSSSI